MNQEYKCPYCGQDSYAKSSDKQGKYFNWIAVNKHVSTCSKNNSEFLIDKNYGPISLEEIATSSLRVLKTKYPKIIFGEKLRDTLAKKSFINFYSKDYIINSIKNFYVINNIIPQARDFKTDIKYPAPQTVQRLFGSWNKAIEAAGFTPNIQNGYGIDTYGLDGHLYRSKAEAYFADNYLFNKVEYEIEPKYPKPYNKYYDWYIPTKNLYIELDGEIRPEITKEKIKINKLLDRNCLFIKTSEIYNAPIGQLVESAASKSVYV